MDVSEQEFAAAQARMSAQRKAGYVTQAFYDPEADRVVVALSTGIDLAFAPRLAEGLAGASAEDLAAIEVSPSGLGLHWPRLDTDLYVPALLRGLLGSPRWMAAQLGAAGGRALSPAKAVAARENGRKGGRPRRQVG